MEEVGTAQLFQPLSFVFWQHLDESSLRLTDLID
jgi:hypothetical protein